MEEFSPRPEDTEAAMALINEHPLLKEDSYTKRVIETGLADNGKPIDIGDFLAARSAVLEIKAAADRMDEIKIKNFDAYDAAVINSVRPDLEKVWLN